MIQYDYDLVVRRKHTTKTQVIAEMQTSWGTRLMTSDRAAPLGQFGAKGQGETGTKCRLTVRKEAA